MNARFNRVQLLGAGHKGIRNSYIYAEVDLTAATMVNLCYDLVQLFGYQQDSLTIECR